MLMKNFTATTKQLDGVSIMVFIDEDGNDWYKSQGEFSTTTLKFMFDEKGNVVAASWDASMLAPENLSVSEIEKKACRLIFSSRENAGYMMVKKSPRLFIRRKNCINRPKTNSIAYSATQGKK
jgi:hypothetical protein